MHKAAALAIAMSFSDTVLAVSIGEIVSQSKLGKPLSIHVELTSETNEIIDSSCLSLVAPDPQEEGAQDYLVSAKLSVTTEMGQQFGVIRSHKPFTEAFGKIRLRVNCPGQVSVTKTLAFLPDLDETLPNLIIAPDLTSEPIDTINPPPYREEQPSAGIALSLSQDAISDARAEPAYRRKAARQGVSGKQVNSQRSPAPPASKNKGARPEVFMFKLSSEPIDESRIGKLSTEERELLLARQKLLDADDQMASFLSMQNQIKQLQDELGDIKLKLAQLGPTSPAAGLNLEDGKLLSANSKLEKIGLFAGGLVLAVLALLLGLRYYNRSHSQRMNEESWKSVIDESASISDQATSPTIVPPLPDTLAIEPVNIKKPAPPAPASTEKRGKTPSQEATSSQTKSQEDLSEADAIIEEAELYSNYGHPDRAALMLEELVREHPEKVEAWELLLSILCSQQMTAKFEQVAHDFVRQNNGSASWKKIQGMGRMLDRDNPFYADDNAAIGVSTTPAQTQLSKRRRLIGNILVESGMVSKHDMATYLEYFDPKRDGRIGEYLISRKAITQEQLETALLIQQNGGSAETSPTADQNIETFLPDFTPQHDDRLGEYIKMDNARSGKPKKT